MKLKLLRVVIVGATLPLLLLWAQSAKHAGILALIIESTILAALVLASSARHRARGPRLLVECATAVAMACFLIWISGGGARPLY
jgi:hypothetical protein